MRDNLERSLTFSGTNRRLRRVLAKFRRGETINVGAIGGSGERAFHLHKSIIERLSSYKRLRINNYDEPYWPDTPTNLHRIIFNHLTNLYPAPNGVKTGDSGREEGKHGHINGGQGALGKIH